MTVSTWRTYGEAYAFLGNSLLKPMTQTSSVGLDPAFWEAFPDFGSDEVCKAANACAAFARSMREAYPERDRAVEQVSVEYTRLFVGPPRPAAAPWETLYRSANVSVAFGEATFEMRRLLREAGLQLCGDNNQYEDHMGIELLYLSVLCGRVAELLEEAPSEAQALAAKACSYVGAHPAAWVDPFIARVSEAAPEGYFAHLLVLLRRIMGTQLS